jgi:ABC-type transporter Mla subunit MlaD
MNKLIVGLLIVLVLLVAANLGVTLTRPAGTSHYPVTVTVESRPSSEFQTPGFKP